MIIITVIFVALRPLLVTVARVLCVKETFVGVPNVALSQSPVVLHWFVVTSAY